MSSKSVLPERSAIVSSKGVLQECRLSVSSQGVPQGGSLEVVTISIKSRFLNIHVGVRVRGLHLVSFFLRSRPKSPPIRALTKSRWRPYVSLMHLFLLSTPGPSPSFICPNCPTNPIHSLFQYAVLRFHVGPFCFSYYSRNDGAYFSHLLPLNAVVLGLRLNDILVPSTKHPL